MTEKRNLDSIIPENMKGPMTKFIKDVFGMTLEFTAVKFSHDDKGDKAVFTAHVPNSEQKFFVQTRAIQPIQVGAYLLKNKKFPVTAKFVPQGQSVLLVDPDAEIPDSQSEYIPD